MRPRFLAAPFLLTLVVAARPGAATDWPQYRGPERSGAISGEGLAQNWEQTAPKEVWRRGIGAGFSAVAIAGDRLYTMESVESEEAVLAISVATGETIWRTVVGETPAELFPDLGPRTTPTIVGKMLYTVSAASRLMAMSNESGEVLWDKDLTTYGPMPRFGYSMSPLVDGDQVLALVGKPKESPGIIAFDRMTGEVKWEALNGPAGYASPLIAEIGGQKQYVHATFDAIVGLSTTGEVLWSHDTGPKTALPMPIFLAPDKVFVATADDNFGGMMIRVTHGEEGFATEELWKERLMRNHFNTSVAVDGYVYGFDNATFRCLDAETGKRMWAYRGFGKGSLIAAGSLLYVLSDNGTVALVRATPAGFEEAGRVKPMEGRSWTTPSLANGHLYLRDADELVSLDVRGEALAGALSSRPAERKLARASFGPDGLSVEQVIARHIEARGGAEGWRALEGLASEGVYAAFSEESDFTMVRSRGDQYRLDFDVLGGHAIRARDGETPWWQHALLQPEPAPITDGPYRALLERESMFGPLLLDYKEKGFKVTLAGTSEINGRPTIDLEVVLSEEATETWHLDTVTYLEVAVDSQVIDHTQGPKPMAQRAFYSDFREVEGLMLPFRVDLEFGARLEEMRVEKVTLNPKIDPKHLEAPPAMEADEAGEEEPEGAS